VAHLVHQPPRLAGVPDYMAQEHSWDARASFYHRLFVRLANSEFNPEFLLSAVGK
jgi:hypothetical protein